jgi:uncharacterized phage protein (TIGR02216 family)
MTRLDWPGLMRAGMVGLRLTPDAFWRLTPAELRLMLGQGSSAAPLNRSGLDELMAKWPDIGSGRDADAPKGEQDD